VRVAAEVFRDFITRETLAREYQVGELAGGRAFDAVREMDLDGYQVQIALSRLKG